MRRDRALTLGGLLLAIATLALVWVCSEGTRSLLHVPLYALALLPGLPLGFALFGRSHAAGWIAGALLGYALTAIGSSAAVHAGARRAVGFLLAWLLLCALTFVATRRRRTPLIELPAWTRRDTTALLFVLLLVPLLMWAPLRAYGAHISSGIRHYRAYFTADFLWHMALTGQLTNFSLPPENPYVADQTAHYYWTYFMVPAVSASLLRPDAATVEQTLEINGVLSGLLFMSAIFLATWAAVPRAGPAAVAVALAVLAASVQGWYGIYDLSRHGRPLEGLRELNINALTAWLFQGLRIDGLPRTLWWTPQHAMACALGLAGMAAATVSPRLVPLGGVLIAGLSLGAALVFSPLLGATFAGIYGLAVVVRAAYERTNALSTITRHALAAVPVAAAFAWCLLNDMWERAGDALAIGLGGLARNAPLQTLALALGPLLVAAIAGLAIGRLRRSAIPHLVGLIAGLGILYFVRLVPDPAWAGFRAGNILQITLPGLAALWIASVAEARGAARATGVAAIALLFVAGLPTTLVDVFNAQDTGNRGMGPGFRWTIAITPPQQSAFRWIMQSTPRDAVLQMEPTTRGRETWSLLPSFALRRVGAAVVVPLLMDADNDRRLATARAMYESEDGEQAWSLARQLKIDYVYVDGWERSHFPGGVAKFDAARNRFELVFRRGDVAVYRVKQGAPQLAFGAIFGQN